MSYTLTGPERSPHTSEVKGEWGGYKLAKIYGRLDCTSALRAITRGGYVRYRVFFADEAAAIAAGYRPCGVCCPSRYSAWKAAQQTPSA
jgi:methylphosphotriester-DNA--protein-cysteine methyltransferase